MRRRDGSGENEFRATRAVIWLRISSREVGWNRTRSFRSVIRSVFEGGDGWESGGRPLISMDSEGLEDDREDLALKAGDEGCECGGEDTGSAILVV